MILDTNFIPTITFIKSKAAFKLRYKDCFGMHSFYFDFLPIQDPPAPIQELLKTFILTPTLLNRLPKLNPYPKQLQKR